MIRIPQNDLGITPGLYSDDLPEAIQWREHLETEKEASKTYIEKRREAYGSVEEQIEFITENGLDQWRFKVSDIKVKYPKE